MDQGSKAEGSEGSGIVRSARENSGFAANRSIRERLRIDRLRAIAAVWLQRHPSTALSLSLGAFFRELARRAAALPTLQEEPPALVQLEPFRKIFVANPDVFRRRMKAGNEQRRAQLSWADSVALRTLDAVPDLLSPPGELHHEPAHSRLIAFLMDPRRSGEQGCVLLRAFLECVGCPISSMENEDLLQMRVTPESQVEKGRVDVRIESDRLLVFVEVKVYAVEGAEQLPRYRRALDRQVGKQIKLLVFLTMPDAVGPAPGLNCEHVTFRDLLMAWLPYSEDGRGPKGFLARYLKSVALLLVTAGEGTWDDWSFSEQRSALGLFERGPAEQGDE